MPDVAGHHRGVETQRVRSNKSVERTDRRVPHRKAHSSVRLCGGLTERQDLEAQQESGNRAALAFCVDAIRRHELKLGKRDRRDRNIAITAPLATLEYAFVSGSGVDHPRARVRIQQVARQMLLGATPRPARLRTGAKPNRPDFCQRSREIALAIDPRHENDHAAEALDDHFAARNPEFLWQAYSLAAAVPEELGDAFHNGALSMPCIDEYTLMLVMNFME